MTADVRRTPRRGTSSRMRHKAHAPDAGTRNRRMRLADASFARSFDPCASILTTHGAPKASSWWGDRSGITVGQTHASGRNQHWGRTFGRLRGSPHVTAPARERAWHVEDKEGGRGLRPCEDQGSRLGCSHVVFQLQKSAGDHWSRISSAYAPQKGRSGSSERGPSSE